MSPETTTRRHDTPGPFGHGVASGDPTTDAVVLWTRVSGVDGPTPVDWAVARDEAFSDVVASGQTSAEAEHDYCVHVDVGGLEPDTHYFYGFRTGGTDSPVGRTRTLPAETAHVTFAMTSCAKFNAGFFNAYSRIAERDDVQFLLHLGDYIYEMSNTPPASQTPGADIGRPYEPLNECITLDDYRTRFAQYHRDPDVQALHLKHPIIPTLDDHEMADGAWRDGANEHKPEYGPWSKRKADAFRAREEWLPIRRPDPDDWSRVFRTIPLGGLAEIYLLDTRSRRDEPVPGDAMLGADRTALGPEQKAWLLDAMDSSTTTWRLLGNPSVMSQTWNPALPEELRHPLKTVKLIASDETQPDWDQWDGFPVERDALLEHFAGFDNLVVLSGDVHVSLALELHRNPFDSTDEPVAVEFVTPSLTSQNLDDKMGWPRRDPQSLEVEAKLTEFLPHWQWCDLDSHGYVVVDVTPERVQAQFWHLDTVLERTKNEELGAAFDVKLGERTPARAD
jgi:alkaline phosphatase D